MSERAPHLSLSMKHQLGALKLDVAFDLTQPWTVLFGPSGSGKSTILRAIAGLVRPDEARIVLRWNGNEMVATDTAGGVFVPPHRRAARWSAQRPALFPNMTVRENLRMVVEDDGAAERALERFQLGRFAKSKPAKLSGGEQQWVSLARAAVAANGRLLLLDEPFSGLDTPLKVELLEALRGWLKEHGTPVLSVTHDVGEAFQLGGDVLRLSGGRIAQQGPVAEVLAEERKRLVALLR